MGKILNKVIASYYKVRLKRMNKQIEKLAKKDLAKADARLRKELITQYRSVIKPYLGGIEDDGKEVTEADIEGYNHEKLMDMFLYIQQVYITIMEE